MVRDPEVGREYWEVDGRLFETLRQAKACSSRICSNHREICRVLVASPCHWQVLERRDAEPEIP